MSWEQRALTTALVVALGSTAAAADPVDDVLKTLNATKTVVGTKESKSYPELLTAYLALSPPPASDLSHTTIHPGMRDWAKVSGWAESNSGMVDAILASEDKTLFGLPYGTANVESEFREADLIAEVGGGGSLRSSRFPYLDAVDTIMAFATAEAYRRLETREPAEIQAALDLMMAAIMVARQCCDREFMDEQYRGIILVKEMLANLRDMLYLYLDDITAKQFREIAVEKLPYLRPDRARLLIPEGDRVVSEALIKEVFDDRGQADREKFSATFAQIQSEDAPLTRFGAAKRWAVIAEVHDSEEASLDRLTLVYDDWWRRWRVEEYDPVLDISTQFDRTNPVRYAAVIYSLQNIEKLFGVRNELLAATYGTAMAAGACGYKKTFGSYPSDAAKMYTQFVRKRSDRDPFDQEFAPFKYRVLTQRLPVDTPVGRLFVEPDEAILYSKGKDHGDARGQEHTDDGAAGDILIWPPVTTLLRENGLLE